MIASTDEIKQNYIRDFANELLRCGEKSENVAALIKANRYSSNNSILGEADDAAIHSTVQDCALNLKKENRKLQREATRAISEGMDAKVIPTAESISVQDAL